MDYNTQRQQLILPEYGRCIQDMVNHAKTLENREERQKCAETIVALMTTMYGKQTKKNNTQQKLWNHLAAMANYELDIDYPVEIEKMSDKIQKREPLQNPQKHIRKPHYGAMIEEATSFLKTMEDGPKKSALILQIANQMKRNMAFWNVNAMNDEKILQDLAIYTDGNVQLLPSEINLIQDSELTKTTQKSKKKKKK
ncbi:MAG: DUF4290 domain-containing protein [Bacteroidaceae bacterium]|nr:DUF4290 domain-containing protein [Bacteroidaceae bacterium]